MHGSFIPDNCSLIKVTHESVNIHSIVIDLNIGKLVHFPNKIEKHYLIIDIHRWGVKGLSLDNKEIWSAF